MDILFYKEGMLDMVYTLLSENVEDGGQNNLWLQPICYASISCTGYIFWEKTWEIQRIEAT